MALVLLLVNMGFVLRIFEKDCNKCHQVCCGAHSSWLGRWNFTSSCCVLSPVVVTWCHIRKEASCASVGATSLSTACVALPAHQQPITDTLPSFSDCAGGGECEADS